MNWFKKAYEFFTLKGSTPSVFDKLDWEHTLQLTCLTCNESVEIKKVLPTDWTTKILEDYAPLCDFAHTHIGHNLIVEINKKSEVE